MQIRPFSTLNTSMLFAAFLLVGCQAESEAPDAAPPVVTETTYVICPEERPKFCTRDYRPVCAQKDTGIRCVTTPCPSVAYFTAGNPCDACSNDKVLGYTPGECPPEKEAEK